MSVSTSELRARLVHREAGLSPPVKYFYWPGFCCGSFMLFLSCVHNACMHVCLLMPCGHLLGKCWPLGSRLWCLIVKLSHSHWYPESGVGLDVMIPDLCHFSYFSKLVSALPHRNILIQLMYRYIYNTMKQRKWLMTLVDSNILRKSQVEPLCHHWIWIPDTLSCNKRGTKSYTPWYGLQIGMQTAARYSRYSTAI